MGPGETLVTLCVFAIPLLAIWTSHRRKMVEMQLRLRQEGDGNTRLAVEALREEMRSLRETAMQYDLSFDSALQRMERRVEGLERKTNGIGVTSGYEKPTAEELRVGR